MKSNIVQPIGSRENGRKFNVKNTITKLYTLISYFDQI